MASSGLQIWDTTAPPPSIADYLHPVSSVRSDLDLKRVRPFQLGPISSHRTTTLPNDVELDNETYTDICLTLALHPYPSLSPSPVCTIRHLSNAQLERGIRPIDSILSSRREGMQRSRAKPSHARR